MKTWNVLVQLFSSLPLDATTGLHFICRATGSQSSKRQKDVDDKLSTATEYSAVSFHQDYSKQIKKKTKNKLLELLREQDEMSLHGNNVVQIHSLPRPSRISKDTKLKANRLK